MDANVIEIGASWGLCSFHLSKLRFELFYFLFFVSLLTLEDHGLHTEVLPNGLPSSSSIFSFVSLSTYEDPLLHTEVLPNGPYLA